MMDYTGIGNEGGCMETNGRILIVEDDYEIARVICDHLRGNGFEAAWASTGKEGWEEFKASLFDMVLVDLMMPEMDGFELCRTIRMESDVPLLIISAKQEDDAKVRGLDLGADDYLTKPFSLQELKARIDSHLRRYRRYRQQDIDDTCVDFDRGLSIDFSKRAVYLHGQLIALTSKEQEILFFIAKHPFRIFEKAEIYEHVWQQADVDGNNTVTVHIKSLRSKLGDTHRQAVFIQTVWGVGYRFIGETQA